MIDDLVANIAKSAQRQNNKASPINRLSNAASKARESENKMQNELD